MLESFKEYFSSTVNTAAQRVSNPVFGAFVLSWSAFNWKSILYLLLSDSSIIDKITYISDNSSWKTVALYPCLSVALLCGGLPWINNFISAWQAKPLDNNDSIDNLRKAKLLHRATRLQRLKAKHDVTYDKVKTGAEKDIQSMKEEIIKSKDSMGELTAELNAKEAELKKKDEELQGTRSMLSEVKASLKDASETILKLNNDYKNLKQSFDEYKRKNKPKSKIDNPLGAGMTISEYIETHGVGVEPLRSSTLDNNSVYVSPSIKDKDKDTD